MQVFFDLLSPYGSWVEYGASAIAGYQILVQILFRIPLMVTGYIQNMDGNGSQTIHGAGLLSIMAGGFLRMTMAGYGFLEQNGLLPGLCGDILTDIMGGLQ